MAAPVVNGVPIDEDFMWANYWRFTPALMARHLSGGQFDIPPHINLISDRLRDVAFKPNKRLMIFTPPRHGKSTIVSHWFPVWFFSWFPDKRMVLASYETDTAVSWSRKVRDTIQEYHQLLDVRLKPDSASAAKWETSKDGAMIATGVGGPLTGRGGDVICIDDPIKNSEEADSETMREKLWDWYRSVVYTRLEPGGSMIIIQTRWHADDLSGRLIHEEKSKDGVQWDLVNLPAIAEDEDMLGRDEGAALWPERYSEEDLGRIRKDVGARIWSAMYQQRPVPMGGGIFKKSWFRYYEDMEDYYVLKGAKGNPDQRILKDQCWRFITADLAFTDRSHSDYTVIQVWDVDKDMNSMILVDQFREQIQAPEVEDQLRLMNDIWQPMFIGIEDRTTGTAAIQRFRRDNVGLIKPLKADRQKVTRALMASIWMENGKVYFPKESHYLSDLESEVLSFPHGKNDDQVDALAYACGFSNYRNLWKKPLRPKLPADSMGKLLGMDQVFNPRPQKKLWSVKSSKKTTTNSLMKGF